MAATLHVQRPPSHYLQIITQTKMNRVYALRREDKDLHWTAPGSFDYESFHSFSPLIIPSTTDYGSHPSGSPFAFPLPSDYYTDRDESGLRLARWIEGPTLGCARVVRLRGFPFPPQVISSTIDYGSHPSGSPRASPLTSSAPPIPILVHPPPMFRRVVVAFLLPNLEKDIS